MRWIKQGRIFAPPHTHAAVPCADPIGDDRYRVYFSDRDANNRSHTSFFEIDLTRPHETLRVSEHSVIEPGEAGLFDDAGAMGTWVVGSSGPRVLGVDDGPDHPRTRGPEDPVKLLYYIGWNRAASVPFRNALGVAISRDGEETFEKFSRGPVLDRSVFDPCFVASACVLREGPRWRMWYLSCVAWDPRHRYHIKYAESDDGIAWRRTGHVCIDFKDASEYAISRPSVIRDGDLYRMWYSYRGESYRIGYAESEDGVHWARKDDETGIDVSAEGWDSEMIEYPHVIRHRGRLYLFYNGNGYGETGIGLAVEGEDWKR